jgi:hypothetical protein
VRLAQARELLRLLELGVPHDVVLERGELLRELRGVDVELLQLGERVRRLVLLVVARVGDVLGAGLAGDGPDDELLRRLVLGQQLPQLVERALTRLARRGAHLGEQLLDADVLQQQHGDHVVALPGRGVELRHRFPLRRVRRSASSDTRLAAGSSSAERPVGSRR